MGRSGAEAPARSAGHHAKFLWTLPENQDTSIIVELLQFVQAREETGRFDEGPAPTEGVALTPVGFSKVCSAWIILAFSIDIPHNPG